MRGLKYQFTEAEKYQNFTTQRIYSNFMGFFARKYVFGVCDQALHKPGCTAYENGLRLEVSNLDITDIRITCPCNVYPLTPHFYRVKLGFTGVYMFFLFLL